MSWIAATAVCVSALLAGVGVFGLARLWRFERALARRGRRTEGAIIERLDMGGDGFTPRVRFVVDGVAHVIIAQNSIGGSVGDRLPVVYLPENPDHARIDKFFERRHDTFSGVVFTLLGGGGLIASLTLGLRGVF